ncbi:MAG: hypothetical protein MUF07_03475 [Steroidobacteraceae bacterium]|nr:hypothetical protein [Steroidobacteraceae bacterium]
MEHTGEFELAILTQAAEPAPAPQPPDTAPSQSMTVIGSLEEMRTAFNRVAASAQRLMSIYTPDLEPEIYDQTEFLDIVKRFVLGRNFAKVRVVLGDGARLLRDGNRFVAMGRRLTSYIDIRILHEKVPQRAASYIIADDRAVALRTAARAWDGVADFNNPPIARVHLAEFDAVWLANQPEPTLRSLPR